jgi:hypothetical protein
MSNELSQLLGQFDEDSRRRAVEVMRKSLTAVEKLEEVVMRYAFEVIEPS